MTIPLGRPSPGASRDRPGRRRGSALGPQGPAVPTWSCSRWGLPCRRRCRRRGALLPHPFTLAAPRDPEIAKSSAVCFLWHFPWGRPRRALPGTALPWSPDFPPPAEAGSGHPAVWHARSGPEAATSQPRPARSAATARATAAMRAPVSASSAPCTPHGRNRRWNAVTTSRVRSSSAPEWGKR